MKVDSRYRECDAEDVQLLNVIWMNHWKGRMYVQDIMVKPLKALKNCK